MENRFGYRVKFDEYITSREEYTRFLEEYFSLFDIMELKVNNVICSYDKKEEFLNKLIQNYYSRISFHFNKNLLNQGLNDTEQFILDCYKYNQPTRCITHLNNSLMDSEFIDKIFYYGEVFKNNILLLENPIIKCDLDEYFNNVKEIIEKVSSKQKNIGLCIDLGHMIVSSSNINKIVSIIEKNELFQYVREFHMHNIINGYDHRPLISGEVDYKILASEIKKRVKSVNFILECEVNKMKEDGIDNISLVRK